MSKRQLNGSAQVEDPMREIGLRSAAVAELTAEDKYILAGAVDRRARHDNRGISDKHLAAWFNQIFGKSISTADVASAIRDHDAIVSASNTAVRRAFATSKAEVMANPARLQSLGPLSLKVIFGIARETYLRALAAAGINEFPLPKKGSKLEQVMNILRTHPDLKAAITEEFVEKLSKEHDITVSTHVVEQALARLKIELSDVGTPQSLSRASSGKPLDGEPLFQTKDPFIQNVLTALENAHPPIIMVIELVKSAIKALPQIRVSVGLGAISSRSAENNVRELLKLDPSIASNLRPTAAAFAQLARLDPAETEAFMRAILQVMPIVVKQPRVYVSSPKPTEPSTENAGTVAHNQKKQPKATEQDLLVAFSHFLEVFPAMAAHIPYRDTVVPLYEALNSRFGFDNIDALVQQLEDCSNTQTSFDFDTGRLKPIPKALQLIYAPKIAEGIVFPDFEKAWGDIAIHRDRMAAFQALVSRYAISDTMGRAITFEDFSKWIGARVRNPKMGVKGEADVGRRTLVKEAGKIFSLQRSPVKDGKLIPAAKLIISTANIPEAEVHQLYPELATRPPESAPKETVQELAA